MSAQVFRVGDILAKQADLEVQAALKQEDADLRELNKTTDEDARCAGQGSGCAEALFLQLLRRADHQAEARAAAAFDSAAQAKAQVKTWTRLHLEPDQAGLPTEVWSAILNLLIEPKLWDLTFVRDICNAGESCCTRQPCL